MTRIIIIIIGFVFTTAIGTASAQERLATVSVEKAVAGDPVVNQCLSLKLGEERVCARMENELDRETCVADVWAQCQPKTRMKVPDATKLPKKYLPKSPCPQTNKEEIKVDKRATESAQKTQRMKFPPTKNPLDCLQGEAEQFPTDIAAEPMTQKACSQCTGTCQTVSWLSGHSSYNGIDVGGGQSPSQCIDQIKQACEAGASRFMFGATCKN